MQSLAVDNCIVFYGFLIVMTIKQSLSKHVHENAVFQKLVSVGSPISIRLGALCHKFFQLIRVISPIVLTEI